MTTIASAATAPNACTKSARASSKPAPKRRAEAPVLDEHARHREPEEGEPGERDEVDPLEDGHARDREREERDHAGHERATGSVPASGRDHGGPEVAEAEGERADDDAVGDPDARRRRTRLRP